MADSCKPENEPRQRDREKTLFQLRLAMNRLQKRNAKVSIASVAKEASVTPALIHNRYADFAEEVRKTIGKSTRAQRDGKHELLVTEREKAKQLREQVAELMSDLRNMASENEALRAELALQRAIATGKVVSIKQ
ncbi:MAG: TetR family transcriptional regulator [Pseudomonadota bacterium]